MDFIQLTEDDVRRMLDQVGAGDVRELFRDIPPSARLERPLCLPEPLNELELIAELQRLAEANHTADELTCFLGGGAYDHFIPTVVDALAGQSEFVTAYTPYQAEASQGSLQAFYEYQTLICQLTGMDVSNASLYEGVNGRRQVAVSAGVHPHTREVLATYLRQLPLDLVTIPLADGQTDPAALNTAIGPETAAVLLQSPNLLGCIEPLDQLIPAAHSVGALAITSVDPISCALLKRPGDLGADIVVGDGQPMGIPLSYGGPSLGFMACRTEFMRKMPGRMIGATTDRSGRRAYCLTLQTREQHIRRERATSNICTNQGLLALRVAIYLTAMGRSGLRRVAELCLDKAHYAADRISGLKGFELVCKGPFFKEFAVHAGKGAGRVLAHCRKRGILAGIDLAAWDGDYRDVLLIAVTEKRTRQQIDALAQAMDEA